MLIYRTCCALSPCRCSYCLQHASTVRAHPLLAEYGVGLRWADLKHLVLSDRAAVDAGAALAEHVKKFLAASGLCKVYKSGGNTHPDYFLLHATAALKVAAYLDANTVQGKETFALRGEDKGTATFNLASQYASSNSEMLDILKGQFLLLLWQHLTCLLHFRPYVEKRRTSHLRT